MTTTAGDAPPGPAAVGATLPMPWLLRRVNQRYRAVTAQRLAAAGLGDLPQPGVWALMAIDRGVGEPNELAGRMGVSKQAVSKLVDRLAAAGFVQRTAVPADRRRTGLVLTAKGRKAVRVIGAAVGATEQAMASELGSRHFAQFMSMLAQLAGGDP
ncbi:MAG: MarR family winged helix-turn-helix transcriptional regulator [Acidimicrobiales bacterium]